MKLQGLYHPCLAILVATATLLVLGDQVAAQTPSGAPTGLNSAAPSVPGLPRADIGFCYRYFQSCSIDRGELLPSYFPDADNPIGCNGNESGTCSEVTLSVPLYSWDLEQETRESKSEAFLGGNFVFPSDPSQSFAPQGYLDPFRLWLNNFRSFRSSGSSGKINVGSYAFALDLPISKDENGDEVCWVLLMHAGKCGGPVQLEPFLEGLSDEQKIAALNLRYDTLNQEAPCSLGTLAPAVLETDPASKDQVTVTLTECYDSGYISCSRTDFESKFVLTGREPVEIRDFIFQLREDQSVCFVYEYERVTSLSIRKSCRGGCLSPGESDTFSIDTYDFRNDLARVVVSSVVGDGGDDDSTGDSGTEDDDGGSSNSSRRIPASLAAQWLAVVAIFSVGLLL